MADSFTAGLAALWLGLGETGAVGLPAEFPAAGLPEPELPAAGLLPAEEKAGGWTEADGWKAGCWAPDWPAENTVSSTPEIITITRHPASSGSTRPSLVSGACSRLSQRRRRSARSSR
jgi:hypothetical protein